jgi:hypothetical protein
MGVSFANWNVFATGTSGIFSVGAPPTGADFNPGLAPLNTLSADYLNLLRDVGSLDGKTLTISGLTVGATYQFQWWANLSVNESGTTTATAGNSVTLSTNTTVIAHITPEKSTAKNAQ